MSLCSPRGRAQSSLPLPRPQRPECAQGMCVDAVSLRSSRELSPPLSLSDNVSALECEWAGIQGTAWVTGTCVYQGQRSCLCVCVCAFSLEIFIFGETYQPVSTVTLECPDSFSYCLLMAYLRAAPFPDPAVTIFCLPFLEVAWKAYVEKWQFCHFHWWKAGINGPGVLPLQVVGRRARMPPGETGRMLSYLLTLIRS